jgi:hypothetical protein
MGTKFVTDLEATFAFTRDIKFSVGANNLFGIYPDKIPAAASSSSWRSPRPHMSTSILRSLL